MPRLLRYVAGTCAALALLEGAFRLLERDVAASTTRAGTKAALLDKQGPVQVLFFGTSRLWDAVSPRAFSAAFPGVRAFSLAASGAGLETLEELAGRFARRPGLRLAVVELSAPQLQSEPRRDPPLGSIEALAARHLRLVEHRAALRGESLLRLQELLLAPRRLDGSEIHASDFLDAWLRRPPPAAADDLRAAAISPAAAEPTPAAARLLAVARELRDGGAQVVFVVPPVESCEPPEDVTAAGELLAAEFPVWSYQAAPLTRASFRDCSHLNGAGRALFSRSLAAEAARAGLGRSLATRSD